MARAPKSAQDGETPPQEAGVLEGWPAPREAVRLFGHDTAAAQFRQAFAGGRLHHAWLISGAPGIGKATLAYNLARHVLASGSPAGNVARQVASLSHPGLFVVRRPYQPQTGKFQQIIPVDEIRRLKHFFANTAVTPWRTAIVDQADDLNISSANALLKLLEEPPARTVFFLISSAPAGLFETIRSRCCRLPLRPLGHADLTAAVTALCEAKGIPAPGAEWPRIAEFACGSPRRALELLYGPARELHDAVNDIVDRLPELDHPALFALIDKHTGADVLHILDALSELLLALTRAGATTDAPAIHGLSRPRRLFSPSNLALWAGLWETMNRARADTERLNLDRTALVLTVFNDMQKTARRVLDAR
jgi:DNA polymerase-3 subunit delta'